MARKNKKAKPDEIREVVYESDNVNLGYANYKNGPAETPKEEAPAAPVKETREQKKERKRVEKDYKRALKDAGVKQKPVVEVEMPVNEKKEAKRQAKEAKAAEEAAKYTFANYPHLKDLKPREKIIYHSDYFQIDNRFGTIMAFFHSEGAQDNFGAFWGVNRIPSGMDNDVEITIFDQVHRMTETWLSDHQHSGEAVAKMNTSQQAQTGSNSSKAQSQRRAQDFEEIAHAVQNGDAYLHVQFRMLVTASSLEQLDKAVKKIERTYVDRFATLSAAPYYGDQKREMSSLFARNTKKIGHGYYFTSSEYAGAYSLVTHGLEDSNGEYIGWMLGDVNNAAVLFNTNGYKARVIVADESYEDSYGDRTHSTALWGSKLSQACMLNNGRCVHLILDNTNLDMLGPKFKNLTYKLDLNKGDVNMFEMFGRREDQLSIFPSQMQKLVLMAEQAYETTEADRSIIRSSLEEIATKFYIDNHMWYENAKEHQDHLRVVGIPHEQVPKLQMFCSYLDMEYKALVNQTARDNEKLHALNVLSGTFKNLLSNNGDLFNTTTSPVIDGVVTGKRVIYDFSKLLQRGSGVAMAQLVNVIAFAVNSLGVGDTIFVHGVEKIDSGVKDYMDMQFGRLFDAGGRVVYMYNSIDTMLADKDFCRYDRADYTVFGNMSEGQVDAYQKAVGQDIPADLSRLVTNKSEAIGYIRRGFDNIVFHRDLILNEPVRTKGGGQRW